MDSLSERYASIFGKIGEWSLYIMIFILPISKSFIEIMFFVALICAVLVKLLRAKPLLGTTPMDLALYFFLAASLLSFMNTQYFSLSLKALFSKSLKYVLLFMVARELIDTREKLNNFVIMAFLSCVVVTIDAFVQYFWTHIDLLHFDGTHFKGYPSFQFSDPTLLNIPGATSPYPNGFLGFPTASFPFPNDFAAWILIVIFPLIVFILMSIKNVALRLFSAVLCTGLIYLLIVTKTRSAWIGFFIGLSLLCAFRFMNIKKLLVMLCIVALLSPFVLKKTSFSHFTSYAGIAERNVMWRNGWQIFKEHPVIGNGINTFFEKYKKIRTDQYRDKKGSYAHNCYLQMAADIGIIGLCAFLSFVAVLIGRAFKALKTGHDPYYYALIAGLAMGIIAFLVHAFFDTNLYSLNLASLFWLSAGILASVIKMSEAKAA
jgi:hypothetical protein